MTTRGQEEAAAGHSVPAPHEREHQIIAGCVAGDRSAFHELFMLHHIRVRRLLGRFVRDEALLDDLVQEAFVAILRSLPQFAGRSRLSTWIYRVTVNVAMQHLRKTARRAAREQAWSTDDTARQSTPPTPEHVYLSRERAERVHTLLEQLSPKRRMVLLLREAEGLDISDIARILGIPRVTARTRLYYARRDFLRLAAAEPLLTPAAGATT